MNPVGHRIESLVAIEEVGLGALATVEPVVDGVPVREMIGSPMHAGLADPAVRWPSRHSLGEPVFGQRVRTGILGCTCGDFGCGPLSAEVTVTGATVTWSNFRGTDCDGDLSGLRFEFARREYEAALQATAP